MSIAQSAINPVTADVPCFIPTHAEPHWRFHLTTFDNASTEASTEAALTEAALTEALTALSERFSVDASTVRPLRSRCGATATLDIDGKVLFKYVRADPDQPVTRRRHRGLVREAEVLAALPASNLIDHHVDDTTAWTLQSWLGDHNVWKATAGLRDAPTEPANRVRLLALFQDMIEALGRLHAAGFYHGDLQPAHFIVGPSGSHLVDFDVAVPIGVASHYGGGMVHFVGPEVAREMAAGNTAIELHLAAEIYSLASVVFFLYTGRFSGWYGDAPAIDDLTTTDRDTKCRAIAAGRQRTFAMVGAEPFPELEQLLTDCLAMDPTARPRSLDALRERVSALLDRHATA